MGKAVVTYAYVKYKKNFIALLLDLSVFLKEIIDYPHRRREISYY